MTPETNHDTEISIYLDFLEDQGLIVDRDPEPLDQWVYEFKLYGVGGVVSFVGCVIGGDGFEVGGLGCDVVGGASVGAYDQSKRVGG